MSASGIAKSVRTCATCGRTGQFMGEWRWGSDPLGPYVSPIIRMTFCSADCERAEIAKQAGAR